MVVFDIWKVGNQRDCALFQLMHHRLLDARGNVANQLTRQHVHRKQSGVQR